MFTILVALFLVAHGLIHLSFAVPRPRATPGGPEWPFDGTRSWALAPLGLGASTTRVLATGLLVVVLAGFTVAAGALAGVLPPALFVGALVAGSVASLAMLGLFFHRWLLLGFGIDAVLLWGALVAGWRPGAGLG